MSFLSRCVQAVAGVASALVAACSAQPALQIENGRLVPPAGQGYVVLAISVQSLSTDRASLQVELAGVSSKHSLRADISRDVISGPDAETRGRLWVLPLAAGRYTVSEAWGEWAVNGSNGRGGQPHFKIERPFQIAAGEVLYLGEINAQLNFAPALSYSDQTPRDFYQLQQWGVQDTRNMTTRLL
ncbi:hypothetical protein [Iodobacter fluviatilis]|uniref:Uncharacterized protein n=1 Tax=Iodobacter fluviatilis TaxID=537 RepID=A0A377Q254_9NEIS|nr:hypothetical protein [Iodobacter fluviatilis]TCU90319.1 hypothetical protein EV682_101345 [Iodobacter fluviatilis]STQ89346.1 Uncharacterised protein [Iodobacter fluviatilis]